MLRSSIKAEQRRRLPAARRRRTARGSAAGRWPGNAALEAAVAAEPARAAAGIGAAASEPTRGGGDSGGSDSGGSDSGVRWRHSGGGALPRRSASLGVLTNAQVYALLVDTEALRRLRAFNTHLGVSMAAARLMLLAAGRTEEEAVA